MQNLLKEKISIYLEEVKEYINVNKSDTARVVNITNKINNKIDKSLKNIKSIIRMQNNQEEEFNLEQFFPNENDIPLTKDKSFYVNEEQILNNKENILQLTNFARSGVIANEIKNRMKKIYNGEIEVEENVKNNYEHIRESIALFLENNQNLLKEYLDTREKTYLDNRIDLTIALKGRIAQKDLTDEDNKILQDGELLIYEIETSDVSEIVKEELFINFSNGLKKIERENKVDINSFKNKITTLLKVKEIEELREIIKRFESLSEIEKSQVISNEQMEGINYDVFKKYYPYVEDYYLNNGKFNNDKLNFLLGLIDKNEYASIVSDEAIVKEMEKQLELIKEYSDEVRNFLFEDNKKVINALGNNFVITRANNFNFSIDKVDIAKFIEIINKLKRDEESEIAREIYLNYNNSALKEMIELEKRRAEYYSVVKVIKDKMKILETNTGKYVPDRVAGKLNYKLETFLHNRETLKFNPIKFYNKFVKVFKDEIENFEGLDVEVKEAMYDILKVIAPQKRIYNLTIDTEEPTNDLKEKIKNILEFQAGKELDDLNDEMFYKKPLRMIEENYKEKVTIEKNENTQQQGKTASFGI